MLGLFNYFFFGLLVFTLPILIMFGKSSLELKILTKNHINNKIIKESSIIKYLIYYLLIIIIILSNN